jgi:hypothetical protein
VGDGISSALASPRARERAAADAEVGRWLLAALRSAARLALGGPRDEGRASYQIALSVCAEGGHGHQPSAGEPPPLPPRSSLPSPAHRSLRAHAVPKFSAEVGLHANR